MSQKSSVAEVQSLIKATEIMEDTQKSFRLAGSSTDISVRRKTVISTGLLIPDVLMYGGIYPGSWYTLLGKESSAKSTMASTILASQIYSDVPLISYHDPEGSTSSDYIMNITETILQKEIDIDNVFGVRDKTKGWVIEPRVWLYKDNVLENIWSSMAASMRRLPDKRYIDGKWWLLFERSKENISRFSKGSFDGVVNTKLGNEYGRICVESMDEGMAQALFIVDSYPAMITESEDTDEGDKALMVQARAHAEHGRKVQGYLNRKHCAMVGINQLRNTIDPYQPEKEPGGNFLYHAADFKMKHTVRAVPSEKGALKKKGALELEPSVFDKNGSDSYRYLVMQSTKNKFNEPFTEAWMRIWSGDHEGAGRGFDPVWDTWEYLKSTGQVDGSLRRGFTIDKNLTGQQIPKLSWMDFKSLILLRRQGLQEFCKKKKIKSNPRIRERCFRQIKSGKGIKMFFEHSKKSG